MKISIRWRLALSFAALALLVTLALGFVLMNILRTYYTQQELAYLQGNADELSMIIADVVRQNQPAAVLESQIKGFTYLSQSRVRLLDVEENVIAESGPPQDNDMVIVSVNRNSGESIHLQVADAIPSTGLYEDGFVTAPEFFMMSDIFFDSSPPFYMSEQTLPLTTAPWITNSMLSMDAAPITDVFTVGAFSAMQTFYGFDLRTDNQSEIARTTASIRQPILLNGEELWGYIELTEGPAYGTQIVNSAANAWAVSSVIAVPLAAAVGWVLSRTISAPIIALTEVTAQMAEGDLGTRAPIVNRNDEVGELAQSFNQMADRVEHTITTLRQFVSDAAHELHTPLTALRTNLELANDARNSEAVARAQTQVSRLEALTAGLLDLSRIEAGDQTFSQVDLATLTREISEIYASQAEQANINFSMHLPTEKVAVRGDDAQLRRALVNLLDNALKFTADGGAVQTLLEVTPTQVRIAVQDTGIGVPNADLPYLFQRFHRGRNANAYPGSGLGLAIVQAIAKLHGGQVMAENMECGARFTLCLPRAQN